MSSTTEGRRDVLERGLSPVWDDNGKIIYHFASQLDFTNAKSREADLAAARHKADEEVANNTTRSNEALAARSPLVHEVDHRVKNNLLTMASIIKMQAHVTKDSEQRHVLMSVLNRLEALSTAQRKLFTLYDVSKFDIAEFIHELAKGLFSATGREDIKMSLDLPPVHVPAAGLHQRYSIGRAPIQRNHRQAALQRLGLGPELTDILRGIGFCQHDNRSPPGLARHDQVAFEPGWIEIGIARGHDQQCVDIGGNQLLSAPGFRPSLKHALPVKAGDEHIGRGSARTQSPTA